MGCATNRLSSSKTGPPQDKNRPWEPFDAVVACLTRQSRCLQEKRGSNMLESEFQIGNSGSVAICCGFRAIVNCCATALDYRKMNAPPLSTTLEVPMYACGLNPMDY